MGQLISGLVLIGVCAVIGMRLCALGARTSGLPELLIGLSFLLAGAAAGGLGLARSLAPVSDLVRIGFANASALTLHAGVGCLAAFTWRVFRPNAAFGRLLFAIVAAGLFLALVGEVTTQRARPLPADSWLLLSLLMRVAVYVWAAAECFGYWLMLRRRARFGFGDPLVANRMLLWGLGTAAIAVIWVRGIANALGAAGESDAVGSPLTTALVVCCAALYWLAFFPPPSYRRWVASA